MVLDKVKLYTTLFYHYFYIDLKFSPFTFVTFEACTIYLSCYFHKLICNLFVSLFTVFIKFLQNVNKQQLVKGSFPKSLEQLEVQLNDTPHQKIVPQS